MGPVQTPVKVIVWPASASATAAARDFLLQSSGFGSADPVAGFVSDAKDLSSGSLSSDGLNSADVDSSGLDP